MSLAAKLNLSQERRTPRIGRLPIEALDLEQTAMALIDYCRSGLRVAAQRPLYSTSVNGQVISLCANDKALEHMVGVADTISADGQPLVLLSKLLCRRPLPERVATTDLFPATAALAEKSGVSFYLLGGTEVANRRAVERIREAYPALKIVGRRDGYFSRSEESKICAEIAALKPDILWVSLGVPLEQQFCIRNLNALAGVGVVKTAGGLLDFISGEKPRAPRWMQRFGLEWLFRLAYEPRRLFVRYAVTNPHAMLVMLRDLR